MHWHKSSTTSKQFSVNVVIHAKPLKTKWLRPAELLLVNRNLSYDNYKCKCVENESVLWECFRNKLIFRKLLRILQCSTVFTSSLQPYGYRTLNPLCAALRWTGTLTRQPNGRVHIVVAAPRFHGRHQTIPEKRQGVVVAGDQVPRDCAAHTF